MAVEEVGIKLNLQGRQETARGLQATDADVARIGTTAAATESKLRKGLGAVADVGKKVAAGVAVSTLAVGAFGIGAAKSLVAVGVGYNDLEQRSRAAMTTLLGSRDAANQMMDSVRDFGKTSPFPRQAFISATQQLLGFGFEAESIIPTLKTINDATAALGGNAETVSRFSDIFAKIKANGRLGGEEVSRLGAIGVDAIAILSKASGKSGEEVRKAISDGAIGADDAITVLTRGMDAKFAGASENVKNTWSGAIDRVKGAWRDLGGDLVAPFVDPNGGGYAVTWANKLADRLRVVQGQVPDVIAKLRLGLTAGKGGGDGSMVDTWERVGFYAGRAWKIVSGVDWSGLLGKLGGAFSGGGIVTFFETLLGSGPQARTQLAKIGDSLGLLGPVFQSVADNAPTLSDALTVTAGVLGFLADHVDTLVAVMPFLVGGWLLYRGALATTTVLAKGMAAMQLVNTIAGIRGTSVTAAQTVAMRMLAIEMARARGATVAEVAALNAGTVSRGRAVIGMAAHKVATIASSAATKAWAAGQWLLNAALTANPIGIAVVAIGALVAGAIYAYRNIEPFRRVVDKAWGGIKRLAGAAGEVFLRFTPLGLLISNHKEIISGLATGWSKFVGVLKDGAKWLRKVGEGILAVPGARKIVGGVSGLFGGGGDVPPVEPRAGGGPVQAGRPYIVGEREPELFVPRTSGVIIPKVPSQRPQASAAAGAGVAALAGGDLHVAVTMPDGEVLGRTVLTDFRARAARR